MANFADFKELIGLLSAYTPKFMRANSMYKFKLDLFNELALALPSVSRETIATKVVDAAFNFVDPPTPEQYEELVTAVLNYTINLVIAIATDYNVSLEDSFKMFTFPTIQL